jgi:hypothetical protein
MGMRIERLHRLSQDSVRRESEPTEKVCVNLIRRTISLRIRRGSKSVAGHLRRVLESYELA